MGYKPNITVSDIAQSTDNPLQLQQAEDLTNGKPTPISTPENAAP
jgi:hypothetical protein